MRARSINGCALACLFAISGFAADTRSVRVSGADNTIPQFVYGGGWTSSLHFVNTSDATVRFTARFWSDSGQPWTVPLEGVGSFSAVEVTIPAKQTMEVRTVEGGAVVQQGWVELAYSGATGSDIGAFATFRQRVPGRPDFEAVVPLGYDFGTRSFLLFDEQAGFSTGIALVATRTFGATTVTFNIRNSTGERLVLDQITLQPRQKIVFSLTERFPAAAGQRGSIELTSSPGTFAALGLRFNPTGAFTSFHSLDK